MVRTVFIEDRGLMLEALKNTIDWKSRGIEPLAFFPFCDDALPYIRKEQPDVVVTDIVMHGMDGLELSRILQTSGMDVKVIIISAYNSFDYAQKALQAGVFDYFEKPIDFNVLADSILRAGEAVLKLRQTREFILNHREVYRERFFLRMMLQSIDDPQQILSEAKFLELDRLDGMVCAAFRLHGESSTHDDAMNRELVRLRLGELLADRLGTDRVFGPYVTQDDTTVFVLTGQITMDKREAVSSLTQISEEFSEMARLIVHAGISDRVEDFTQLGAAFGAASRALEACFFFSENCVIHVSDLSDNTEAFWLLLNHFESRILRSISMQDMVAVQNAINILRNENTAAYLYGDALRILMKSIVLKIESLYMSADIDAGVTLQRIDEADNLEEVLQAISEYCADVCGALRNNRLRLSKRISGKAKAYIDEHYASMDLSVNAVAEYVSTSPNYLCSLFKREVGQGIHEYMTARRIERARYLLIHTDKSVGAVGMEVGYPNPYHFSVTFKKCTDLSPSEYRKRNRIDSP